MPCQGILTYTTKTGVIANNPKASSEKLDAFLSIRINESKRLVQRHKSPLMFNGDHRASHTFIEWSRGHDHAPINPEPHPQGSNALNRWCCRRRMAQRARQPMPIVAVNRRRYLDAVRRGGGYSRFCLAKEAC